MEQVKKNNGIFFFYAILLIFAIAQIVQNIHTKRKANGIWQEHRTFSGNKSEYINAS